MRWIEIGMSKSKRSLFIIFIYLAAFAGTIFIASAIINRGNIVTTEEVKGTKYPDCLRKGWRLSGQ